MGSVLNDTSLVPTPTAIKSPFPTSYLFNGTDYPGQWFTSPPTSTWWSPPHYDEPPEKGLITAVIALLIIFGTFCLFTLLTRSCMQPNNPSPQRQSTSNSASTANSNTTNDNNYNARPTAIREQPTSKDMVLDAVRKMSVDDRKLFLSNVLKTEKYKSSLAVLSGGDGSSSFRKVFHKFSPDCCSICLEGFQNGEEMCASPNQACSHVFHHDCIFDWLLTHEICPICRRNYLQLDSVRSVRQLCCNHDVEGGGFPESSMVDPISSDM